MKFKVGDHVFLRPNHRHHNGNSNPLGVAGTVVEFKNTGLPVSVSWSNGTRNVYSHEDLIHATKLGELLAGVEDEK